MLCRWLKTQKSHNKRNSGSLQAIQVLSPPAQHGTSTGRVPSGISLKNGSLTVEAAFVVPLLCLAIVMLLNMADMMWIKSRVLISLNESVKCLGMYACAEDDAWETSSVQSVETGACIAYAQARLPSLERVSVSLIGSSYQNHVVDLNAKVTYQFPVRFAGIQKATFYCRARVHAWTGYRAEEKSGHSNSEEMVYITDRQTVYHTHEDCSHLQLSIQCTTKQGLSSKRNLYGEMYRACPRCKPNSDASVFYITLHGDKYHCDSDCQALTRTGRLVSKSTVSNLKECSRCAERD